MMSGADETVVDVLDPVRRAARRRLPARRRRPGHRLPTPTSPARRRARTCARASPTLPVLRLRARAAAAGSPRTSSCASCSTPTSPDDARHAEALRRLRAHPALEQAREDTVRYAEEARAALAPLPECAARRRWRSCATVVHARPPGLALPLSHALALIPAGRRGAATPRSGGAVRRRRGRVPVPVPIPYDPHHDSGSRRPRTQESARDDALPGAGARRRPGRRAARPPTAA